MTTVDTQNTRFLPDAKPGALTALQVTLGAAWAVSSVNIPQGSQGFKLRASEDLRFAINEDPEEISDESTAGGYAFADETEIRLIGYGATTLRLASATADLVVTVEFF